MPTVIFLDKASLCSPGMWCVDQADLERQEIYLPLPPECLYHTHTWLTQSLSIADISEGLLNLYISTSLYNTLWWTWVLTFPASSLFWNHREPLFCIVSRDIHPTDDHTSSFNSLLNQHCCNKHQQLLEQTHCYFDYVHKLGIFFLLLLVPKASLARTTWHLTIPTDIGA